LDELKERSIASCRMWKDAGKPRDGPIRKKYIQDKLIYKKRIREERCQETTVFTNELHEALLRKSGQDFWKQWNSKFENKSSKVLQVNGSVDNATIAENFAKHFEKICTPHSPARNDELKAEYLHMRSEYCGSPLLDSETFDVQLVDELVREMKNGKAAGLDSISCEHLKYSHPIVIVVLCKLFNLFIRTSHIPASFGLSYTVPIPKCDGRSRSLTADDFRGISISPVISKLFELAILNRFGHYFETSSHQFGFKKRLGCCHAIYSIRNVIEHFISNGSTVNVCAIDLSKAYDRMNKFALYKALMERKLPIELLTILEDWLNFSETCVKWGDKISGFFKLLSGIRQGGVLSPVLFAIFIDILVYKITVSNIGCYMSSVCVSIFLYADDILLISPSITGLQQLVNICESELVSLDMQINTKKSVCIRFGHCFDAKCENIVSLHGGIIAWVKSCRYLGVFFVSGRLFKCSFDHAKSTLFRSFNSIFGKVGRFASEEVVISLLKAKCLPGVLYGLEACPLVMRDKRSFDFSITRLFMKLFRTGSAAIIEECQKHFEFLPIRYIIDIRTASFIEKFTESTNHICLLFKQRAAANLKIIFSNYGSSVCSSNSLKNVINSSFFGS